MRKIHTLQCVRVDGMEQRRSSIQVVELESSGDWITCDRDALSLTPSATRVTTQDQT